MLGHQAAQKACTSTTKNGASPTKRGGRRKEAPYSSSRKVNSPEDA